MKKAISILLTLSMLLSLCSFGAAAAEEESAQAGSSAPEQGACYVLMNIPYAQFYAAEGAVDAVTSATLNGKARNVNVNGASYHESEEAVSVQGISGVMFPVQASADQLARLKEKGAVEVTGEDEVSYEMSARGQTSTVTLKGPDALQERPSYSYCVLSDAPMCYKPLTVAEDGTVSFGAVVGTPEAKAVTGKSAVTVPGRHTNVEISLDDTQENGVYVTAKDVSAVIVKTDEESYALHHVVNIWRGTELGWNLSDLPQLSGQNVTGLRYFLKDGAVRDYSVELAIPDAGFVLMNIPYSDFYAAEVGENGSVDAVSGATLKFENKGIAAGSYHETDAATDADSLVAGATYPVLVTDRTVLDAEKEIHQGDKGTINLVTGREKTVTATEVEGRDLLFCAPSYSWYALSEAPARYKALKAGEDGGFTFSAVSGRATALKDVTARASYHTHHGNFVEIVLGSADDVSAAQAVNGAVVTLKDAEGNLTKMGLPHVQGIWQKVQLGWPSAVDVAEKTLTNVTFFTEENVYSCDVDLYIKKDTGDQALTAAFTDADTLSLSGLLPDMENVRVTVQTGRGSSAVTLARDAQVTDGAVKTEQSAVDGTTYTVTAVSDNYADLSAQAVYTAPSGGSSDSGSTDGSSDSGSTDSSSRSSSSSSSSSNSSAAAGTAETAAPEQSGTTAAVKTRTNRDGSQTTSATETTVGEDGSSLNVVSEVTRGSVTNRDGSVTERVSEKRTETATDPDGVQQTTERERVTETTSSTAENADGSTTQTDTTREESTETTTAEDGSSVSTAVTEERSTETTRTDNEDGTVSATAVTDVASTTTTTVTAKDGTQATVKTERTQHKSVDTVTDSDGAVSGSGTLSGDAVITHEDGSVSTERTEGSIEVSTDEKGTLSEVITATTTTTAPDGSQSRQTLVTTQAETVDGSTATAVEAEDGSLLSAEASISQEAFDAARENGVPINVPLSVNPAERAEGNPPVSVQLPFFAHELLTLREMPRLEIGVKRGNPFSVAAFLRQPGGALRLIKETCVGSIIVPVEGSCELIIADNSKNFRDVSPAAWYSDSVAYVTAREIFNGESAEVFSPDAAMNRAMAAQILYNLDRNSSAGSAARFTDVKPGDWFADAVGWAVEQEIVSGYGNSYGAEDSITRQDLAVLLYRYAQGAGCDTSSVGSLAAFTDAASAADYAQDALRWAVGSGILSGMGDGTLNPTGTATRAQVASMMRSFISQL